MSDKPPMEMFSAVIVSGIHHKLKAGKPLTESQKALVEAHPNAPWPEFDPIYAAMYLDL